MIGLYIIHKFCNHQFSIIVWKWILMVPPNCNLFQNCYCRSPFENLITALLVTQYMVESKKWYTQKIISLSVILHYVHYCHPNLKKVIKIQGYVWLWMLHIFQNYTFLITIMARLLFKKTQGSKPKFSKQKVLGKIKSHIWNI